MNVTMNTSELIDIVTKNMSSHITEFNTAFKAYSIKLLVVVENLRRSIIEGKTDFMFDDIFNLPRPTSHEEEYRNTLHLLKNHKGTTIELNTVDYKQYVLDEWNWTRNFKGVSATYSNRL